MPPLPLTQLASACSPGIWINRTFSLTFAQRTGQGPAAAARSRTNLSVSRSGDQRRVHRRVEERQVPQALGLILLPLGLD